MIEEIFHRLARPCDKFEHYFPLYERHFGNFVGKGPRILEIGVQFGGSAEMWHEYFGPGTQVHGVDIDPLCSETDYLSVTVGDQGSDAFWRSQFAGADAGFDIIIDDGSHDNPHQIATLRNTYRLLRDGGVYWCEDTHTSYYAGVRVADGGYRNPGSFIEYTKQLVDVIHAPHAEHAVDIGPIDGPRVPEHLVSLYDRIQGVHFYDSVVVIEKGPRITFRRIKHEGRRGDEPSPAGDAPV